MMSNQRIEVYETHLKVVKHEFETSDEPVTQDHITELFQAARKLEVIKKEESELLNEVDKLAEKFKEVA